MNYRLLFILWCWLITSTSFSQQTITLSGEIPLQLTYTGSGTFNKTAIYNSTNGFIIDLAKSIDNISGIPIDFKIDSRGGGHNFLTVKGSNGNIGVGTLNPGYKLDVIGTIRSREIKVEMQGADFVFAENYGLMPLSELEAFVKMNKHLPQIEKASDMEAEGVELGALNSKLLQKIEELTLYVIELKKEIEQIKSSQDK
ncbi:hypothetical protein SAMN04489724_3034 [Algoriphagus locisalis]|uniref:Uncharacterized protein n=1 Tax=Algoriphagus locisalis TaxID=305507 RepID=A0A1I7CBD4_9BACT|nr:hypothetical protein [Algoriphagus locisalis]SFT96725.1 hypothetical protein SAMN04489724_3034 [Algoriphagus locisalis]